MLHSFENAPSRERPCSFNWILGISPTETRMVETAAVETPEAIFARVFRVLRPRTPLPEIEIQWRKYASVHSSVRLEEGKLSLKISDLLQSSPAPVMEALAFILLGKALSEADREGCMLHRYNLYLNRRDVRRDMHLVRQTRGRKFISGPKGQVYDLAADFQRFEPAVFQRDDGVSPVRLEPHADEATAGALRSLPQCDHHQQNLRQCECSKDGAGIRDVPRDAAPAFSDASIVGRGAASTRRSSRNPSGSLLAGKRLRSC